MYPCLVPRFNPPGESHNSDTLNFFPEFAYTLHQTGAFENHTLLTTFFCVMGLQEPDGDEPIPVQQLHRSREPLERSGGCWSSVML